MLVEINLSGIWMKVQEIIASSIHSLCAVSMIMQVSDIGPKWLPYGNPYEDMLNAIKKTPMMRWKWLPSSYDNAIGIN